VGELLTKRLLKTYRRKIMKRTVKNVIVNFVVYDDTIPPEELIEDILGDLLSGKNIELVRLQQIKRFTMRESY
jgi:hypothetical protein